MATNENNEGLVKIFDTEQESEALVVRGLLESAGIQALIVSLDAPQDILPGVGGVVVQVAPEDAEKAKQLIKDYRDGAPVDEEELTKESPL